MNLERTNIELKELLKGVSDFSFKEAESQYEYLQILIPKLIDEKEKLDELELANNIELKVQFRNTLDLSYILEARLKKVVKSRSPKKRISEDKLKLGLSYYSKKNLISKIT